VYGALLIKKMRGLIGSLRLSHGYDVILFKSVSINNLREVSWNMGCRSQIIWNTTLGILEQARLVEELKDAHGMSTADIAGHLEKSKAWVSVRSGIMREMSRVVMEKVFSGQFPVYAYMYTLRRFIRINKIKREDIDEFVGLVSGRNLSIRDIELLAKGYFKGSEEFREQLRKGDITFGLQGLRDISGKWQGCTQAEQAMLRDLELAQVYMQRIGARSEETEFKTSAFFAQANLLTGGILRQMELFTHAVRHFHDRTGKT
jgi:hypothetical protein